MDREKIRGSKLGDHQMIQMTEAFIRQHHMIEAGDHIIVGASGGADSMCLLLVLLQLREVFGHSVSAVHVEHGIRGEAARMDAEFVRHFCEEHRIECHICHCHVPEYARVHGMGEEEAGRKLRYAAFRAQKGHYPGREVKIAVAHNLGDNAETMLFYLARGTGLSGLAGIAPVRGDVIRPLLTASRAQIEAYLEGQGQSFCTDATNETDIYSRNRIRHQAISALCQVNSRAAEHMYQAAEQLREIDAYLKKQAQAAQDVCCTMEAYGAKIKKGPFEGIEAVLQKEMLHQLLGMLAGSGKDLTREHVCQVRELFGMQNGRRVSLPYGMEAVRAYGGVEIYLAGKLGCDGQKEGGPGKNQFSFRVIEDISEHMSQISKKKYTKCFDYDKIKNGFCVRNRQPGDYLVVDASGSRQKLKKYLVNEKVPVQERERLLLLADGAHIMWVVGYRISSYYKVSEHTRKILEVTFCGGKENE